LSKNPPPESGKSEREQELAAYARSGKAPVLLTSDAPNVRHFKHPVLPEGQFCLLSDLISAIKVLAAAMTQGLTGQHRVVAETKAISNIRLGVISVADATNSPRLHSLFDPEQSASEQVKGLREVIQTIQKLKEAYALDPTLPVEKANEIVQHSSQPERVRAVLGKLKAREITLHTEGGDSIVMPSSADLPKSLASARDHVVLGEISSGFNDDTMQANVNILKLIDADTAVLQEGVHLRINCSDKGIRSQFLIAQATRCVLKLTLSIPAIPLVPGRMYAVTCNLHRLEIQPSEHSAQDLQKFKQATFDFGKND